MPITKEITLYTFSELSEEVQNKIIERNRYTEVEYWEWYQSILSDFLWGAEENHGFIIDPKSVEFSVGGSQGDGAVFYSLNINFEKLLTLPNFKKFKNINGEDIEIEIVKNEYASMYSHSKTCKLYVNNVDCFNMELLEELEKCLENYRLELCQNLYGELKDYYDYLTSDEHLTQIFSESEDLYFINGDLERA